MNHLKSPEFDHIIEAAQRIQDAAWFTPVLNAPAMDQVAQSEVYLKCENFQRTGAFKFRGAFNALSALTVEQRSAGVITHSSGNHGQAVARVGQMLNVETVIVMPDNAPAIKRAAAVGYGAQIVGYDPNTQKREEVSNGLAQQHGYTLIPPFNHPHVIAGQGTAALELFQEKESLDTLLVPCGGGGLLSGCAIAAKAVCPQCRVVGIEPETADDATQSFNTGAIVSISNPQTIADGTRTEALGDITFDVIRKHVDAFVTVSEAAIKEAVRFCYFRLKLVVEPSGALGIAALMSGAIKNTGRTGIIISGGNIDGPTAASILGEQP